MVAGSNPLVRPGRNALAAPTLNFSLGRPAAVTRRAPAVGEVACRTQRNAARCRHWAGFRSGIGCLYNPARCSMRCSSYAHSENFPLECTEPK